MCAAACSMSSYFNPPIPCGMGPCRLQGCCPRCKFQSTHPVWDGTAAPTCSHMARINFNPPIPCGMGRQQKKAAPKQAQFQSTHPVWDGTARARARSCGGYISIHPSRVGWDQSKGFPVCAITISIHPSRVGWDLAEGQAAADGRNFNPPIPCGMGRPSGRSFLLQKNISIHPSRVGWDLDSTVTLAKDGVFQSTHPVWDGTSA